MKLPLLPLYLIHCLPAYSQVVHHLPGATHLSSGTHSQPFSFLSNQASLASLPQAGACIFTEQRFGLKQLAFHLAAAAMPLNGGGVGLALQYSGFSAFNQSSASLAYGRNLGRIGLGVQFNYTRISMGDVAIGAEVSSRWSLTRKLIAGVRLANPLGGKFLQAQNEKLASVFQLGIGYEASDDAFVSMEIIKEEDRALNVLAGVQYSINKKLFTRAGIATATNEPFFSAGWQWKNCRADVMVRYHQQLGFSPGLMLLFFGKQSL